MDHVPDLPVPDLVIERTRAEQALIQEPLFGIDLFAGAGGLSLGARWAGISVRAAIELKESTCKTYARNHPGTLVVQGDLRFIERIHCPSPERVIVFGGPPCQGFSTSNQRTRTTSNTNNWMFEYFVRMVSRIKPGWVLFENVEGITHTAGGLFLDKVEASLKRHGYRVTKGVLNAADFGVPQRRKRFFLIGALEREPPDSLMRPSVAAPVTVHEAIADLPVLANGALVDARPYRTLPNTPYATRMRGDLKVSTNHLVSKNAESIVRRYRHIPPGGNWEDIPASMMRTYADRTRCHTGIYHRLDPNAPAVVIGNFRKNMLIHPTEDRGLSVREAARLQSFPDWYHFEGTIGLQQQQVGNAVPPLLAHAVFERIVTTQMAVDKKVRA